MTDNKIFGVLAPTQQEINKCLTMQVEVLEAELGMKDELAESRRRERIMRLALEMIVQQAAKDMKDFGWDTEALFQVRNTAEQALKEVGE